MICHLITKHYLNRLTLLDSKQIKLKERKNSDLDLIIKCSSDKSYIKNLNDDFCAINNYLYDTSEDIFLPSNKTAKKFPLAEYKKIIQES